jgi:arsenate reductase
MGEGWARHLLGKQCVAASAGVRPGVRVDPLAIKAMAEVGIDISTHYPKTLDEVTAEAQKSSE